MNIEAHQKWRNELTNHQIAIDTLEEAYNDQLCDEPLTASEAAKAEIEYKIERRRLVAKLEAHYKAEPTQ